MIKHTAQYGGTEEHKGVEQPPSIAMVIWLKGNYCWSVHNMNNIQYLKAGREM
jgi:hypothetical protein